ncbi:ABC transporter permease [Paenibacillus sp. GP183]|jgi:ABC-2 type transport system permease protein|uniref:ABC transporter permease n=1 Tax=Paenibacillus sp. GP183 TaxID=1882751 RepID=UPI0008949897|nr:ABC transporter permease [Paenibacillus sp. GP183]SEB43507.1 ABC-2 type transport system permease protein [Paenibacillus sp. GP183]
MNIWTIAKYEVQRMMTSRTVLLIQFALPLILIFILGSALSNQFQIKDKAIPSVSVALVQQDSGSMNEELAAFLKSGRITDLIHITTYTTSDEAKNQIKLGKEQFGLVVPADFSDKVMRGGSAEWEMILGNDYDQNLTAQMVFGSFLDQINFYQSLSIAAGPNVQKAAQPSGEAAKYGAADNSFVQMGKLSASDANYSASQYYAAAMLVMFLLYSGMSAAISMMNEKEKHTLMRLNSMPIPEVHLMFGKITGNAFITMLQSFVIIAATTLFYGVNWGHSYGMLAVVCLCLTAVSMSLAVMISMLAGSIKAVITIFQFLIMAMTFLSGGFSPLPDGFLHTIGEFTVNHWALQSMLRMMLESDVTVILQYVTILGMIAVGLLIISLGAYRMVGYHE